MENDYQAILSVFIFLLCLNLVFWVMIACWRFCTLITITRALSLNRIVSRFQNFRYFLQRQFFRRRVTRITNLNNLNGISNRNLDRSFDLNSDLPPSYEEFSKYPSKYPTVSTICSNVVMNSATILNISNANDLDSFNLLAQLENQRQSILLCTGNCNCLNHLSQSITSSTFETAPQTSSTATTSTLNTSTVNTTFTIIDEHPIANRNLIVETNLTTFSNDRPNLYNENTETIHQDATKDQTTDIDLPNTLVLNPNLLRNSSQLNRSSTFNDLQSYLKNYFQNR